MASDGSSRTAKAEKEHTQEESDADVDENLGKIIEVFKPYLLRNLRVSHLLCLLPLDEVKDVAPEVHEKDNAGQFAEASKILLGAISKSEQPGKWRMFIDALIEVEDTEILQTLLDEKPKGSDPDPWLDNQANRHLIDLFSHSIEARLRLEGLFAKLISESLILDRDYERLSGMLEHGKRIDANGVLLMVMHRHSSVWYKSFLTILYNDDDYSSHRLLAEEIDPDFCEKLKKKTGWGDQSSSEADGAMGHRPEVAGPSGEKPGISAVVQRANAPQVQPTNTPSLVRNMSSPGEKDVGAKWLPRVCEDDKKRVATSLPQRPPHPSHSTAQPPPPSSSSRHHPPPPSSPRSQLVRSLSSSSSPARPQTGEEAGQREATCAVGCTRVLEEVTSLKSEIIFLRSEVAELKQLFLQRKV